MANEIILVVDADTKSQKVLEVSFKKAGYQVEITDTMKEAIQRVALLSPDLIVADTRLPDGDGFTFLEQLRANPALREVPFIFLTEEDGLDKKMKGFELGAADYLTKPIYIKEVTSRVELLLQKRAKNALADADTERVEGDLAQITMIDLLQTIERELRSGTIELQREDGYQASVYFREGNILDAVCGNLQGEEALYRLMLWPKGRFVINYHEMIRRADHIEKDSTALLMEGMRRFDRWNEMVRTLPHLSRIFEADYRRLPAVMSDLPSEVGRVVRLFDGYRTLRHVIDESPVDDITTLRIIRKLLDDDILLDVTPADAELRQTAQRTNLAAWLSGKIKDEGEAPARAPEASAGPSVYDTTDAASTNPGLPFSPGEREFEEGQVPDADAPGDVSQWRFHWDNERGEAVRTLREESEVSEDAFELESLEDDLAALDRRRQEEEARRIQAEREALEEQLREREEEAAAIRALKDTEDASPAEPEPAPEPEEVPLSADSTGDQWKISELDIEPEATKPVPEPEPEPEPEPVAQVEEEEEEEAPREVTQELHRNSVLAEIERRHKEEEAARERAATPLAMPAQARAEGERAADSIDPLSGVEDMFPAEETGEEPEAASAEPDEVATAEIPRAGTTSAERRAAAIEEADEVAREARELAESSEATEEERASEIPTQPLIPLGSDEDLAGEPEVSAEDLERLSEASSDQLPIVEDHVDEYSLEELDTSEPEAVDASASGEYDVDASMSGEYDVDASGEYEDDEYYDDDEEYYEDEDGEYYEDDDEYYEDEEYYDDEEGEYYEDEDDERPTLDRTARDRELVHAEYDLKGGDADASAEEEYEDEEEEDEPVPVAAAVSTAPLEDEKEPIEEPKPALDAPLPPAEEESGFNTFGLLAVAAVVIAILGIAFVASKSDENTKPKNGKKPAVAMTNNAKTNNAPPVTNAAVTNNGAATNAGTTVAAASNNGADAGADAGLLTLTPEEAGAEATEIAGSVHREAAIVALTRRGVDVATIADPINHVVPEEVASNDTKPEDPKNDGAKKDPKPKDTGTPKTDGGEKPPKDDGAKLAADLKAVERLINAEKQSAALKKAKKLVSANPKSGKARGLLGRAQLYSNNDRAIRDMNKAMEMGYKSPRLVLDLATAYQITGKDSKAKQIYKFFLKSYPKHKQAGAIKAILKNQL